MCQLLATGRWFSPGPLVSSTNKTDHHNIAEILLKVVLNTMKQTSYRQLELSVMFVKSYTVTCPYYIPCLLFHFIQIPRYGHGVLFPVDCNHAVDIWNHGVDQHIWCDRNLGRR